MQRKKTNKSISHIKATLSLEQKENKHNNPTFRTEED